MIWQNPWAFAGLLAVAIPIVIHLLSKRTARLERFPTLRFLEASQSAPVRFTRITDPLLLILRVLIIAAAVAALAQPLLRTASRTAASERQLVRAVILDTSASMRGATDEARRNADALVAQATEHLLVPTARPADVLAGASSWLSAKSGRREMVIVSDFQVGTVDSIDLRLAPADVALRFARVTAARVPADTSGATNIALLTASRPSADAALSAAKPVAFDTSVSVAIVYADAPERASLMRDARTITDARYANAVVALRRDDLLAAALQTDVPSADTVSPGASFMRVSRAERTRAPVFAAQARMGGRETLVLFASFGPGTLPSAALIASAARAFAPEPPAAEFDPRVIPDATLESWARSGELRHSVRGNIQSASDGRWLWLLVLALLGAEFLLRRKRRDAPAGVSHAS